MVDAPEGGDAEEALPSDLQWLDRVLQRLRIGKAAAFVADGDRVIDVGCADGTLFERISGIREGLGIDPGLSPGTDGNVTLRRGRFPAALGDDTDFDVLCALAVFEHIPEAAQDDFVAGCLLALRHGGLVVITVPAPIVDHLLEILQKLHLLKGMETEEHWGFSPATTVDLFKAHGFTLLRHRRFELGLNHLFVFQAP